MPQFRARFARTAAFIFGLSAAGTGLSCGSPERTSPAAEQGTEAPPPSAGQSVRSRYVLPDPGEAIPVTRSTATSPKMIRIAKGADRTLLRELELIPQLKPWIDERTGEECWVLGSVTSATEQRLAQGGFPTSELSQPAESRDWSAMEVEAFNLVAKQCQLDGGDTNIARHPDLRVAPPLPDSALLTPIGAPDYAAYSSYYLLYDTWGKIPGFTDRLLAWKAAATKSGYPNSGIKVPAEFLGGYPLDPNAPKFPASSWGPTDTTARNIPYIDIGWPSKGTWNGTAHEGPSALVFITANQHPRELITAESAWRIAQRLVRAYVVGPMRKPVNARDEWNDEFDNFWKSAFDRGLHVVIVPTANPTGYQWVTWSDWPNNPTGGGNGWRRNNGNNVDLNRNWPSLWLQGGHDAGETWGQAGNANADSFAGTKPGSEPEVQGIMQVLSNALGHMAPNVSAKRAGSRLPAVALDLHSSYGTVLTGNYFSNAPTLNGDAWLCGAASDCIHPDMPAMRAIWGDNARPSVVGNTGLVASGLDRNTEDPSLAYLHGRDGYNIYVTSGDVQATYRAPMWTIGKSVPRGIPSALVEVTAYRSSNPFGFGTCAAPDMATAAIDQVVLDLLPVVSRMAEAAFDPADVAPRRSPLDMDTPNANGVEMQQIRDINNLGVVSETPAVAKTWVANSTCTTTEDQLCFKAPCDSTKPNQQCSGTWWSAYDAGDLKARLPKNSYWAFAVRQPDASSLDPDEAQASEARLALTACAPAERCPASLEGAATRIRRGSYFDLYALPIQWPSGGPPRTITVERQLVVGGALKRKLSSVQFFVGSELPANKTWDTYPDASTAQARLELGSLITSHDRLLDVRVDAPIVRYAKDRIQLGVRWIRNGKSFAEPLRPGRPDYLELFTSGLQNTDAKWSELDLATYHLWYTYDFDLAAAAGDGYEGTTGKDIFVARNDGDATDVERAIPTVTAGVRLFADQKPICGIVGPCCSLMSIGTGASALGAARSLRDSVLAKGPWGRRYMAAYEQYSAEATRIITKSPQLRTLIATIGNDALAIAQGQGSLKQTMELNDAATQAYVFVVEQGSPELKSAATAAVKHLPELILEVASRGAPADAIIKALGAGIGADW